MSSSHLIPLSLKEVEWASNARCGNTAQCSPFPGRNTEIFLIYYKEDRACLRFFEPRKWPVMCRSESALQITAAQVLGWSFRHKMRETD